MVPVTSCSVGLFQKFSSEGGPHFFFRLLHPLDTRGVGASWPPGHVSALINPPHYRSNTPWLPGQVTAHPSDTLSTKHPPPTGQKSACAPPRIISGTALSDALDRMHGECKGIQWGLRGNGLKVVKFQSYQYLAIEACCESNPSSTWIW